MALNNAAGYFAAAGSRPNLQAMERGSHQHRVILEILQCVHDETPTVTMTTEAPQGSSSTRPPLIKNVLGENLYTSIQDFFSSAPSPDTPAGDHPGAGIVRIREVCDSLSKYDIVVEENVIIVCGVLMFAVLFICIIAGIVIVKRRLGKNVIVCARNSDAGIFIVKKRLGKNAKASARNSDGDSKLTHTSSSEIETVAGDQSDADNSSDGPSSFEKHKQEGHKPEDACTKIPLSYQMRTETSYTRAGRFDLPTFLTNISETLFSKLDQLLLKDPLVDQTRGHATIATPRLARRPLGNRHRVGSTPSLHGFTTTTDENSSSFIERKQAWDTLKAFAKEMNWKRPDYLQLEDSKLERTNQRLLHYYQRVCPIKSNHWKVTELLTNFALFLLQAERENFVCQNGYRLVKFIPTGSGHTGTMVGRPNQFDVLMILQGTVPPTYAVTKARNQLLPPGHVLIGAQLPEGASIAARETTCHVRLDKEKLICISSREFSRSAIELTDLYIQSLYTKTRSLMDRLPFVIRKSPTSSLTVTIDTRSLVGLGLPEIKINIIPALPLPLNGWYQAGMMYAAPVPDDVQFTGHLREQDLHRSSQSKNSISSNCLWQVNCDEINDLFLHGVDLKMCHAGVEPCHQLCLMILKTLFTGKDKNSLLDLGTIQSYILNTVVNFLLLESTPDQWSIDKMSDRFSDLIHFLRSAFRFGRLPSFFFNNPHLISKMPAVTANQILTRKRQKNLLADMPREKLDRCLDYIDSCLSDARLADLVKGEYSSTMWEYEFFIFN